MRKETWLRTKTYWKPKGGAIVKKIDKDYQLTIDVDGIPISEIKGWIKDKHEKVVSSFYWYSKIPATQTSRPQKNVERYTTKIDIGCWQGIVETNIVKVERDIPDPQLELF